MQFGGKRENGHLKNRGSPGGVQVYLQVEGVVGHLRVGVQHVAEAAVVAREEHHEAKLYDESRHGDDGQQVLLVPVHGDVVDVDLRTDDGTS